MSNKRNAILVAGAAAAALSGQPVQAHSVQNNTRASASSVVNFGVVNHGRENGVSVQVIVPQDSVTYGISADKSKNETHAIIGAGKSFDNGYKYATASYAREKHFGKNLEGYGASVGGAYATKNVTLDGNVIVHKGRGKHLDTKVTHNTNTTENITGNIKTTTTTHTTTTTDTHFDGKHRGYANLGAKINIGQNGEARLGVQQEFGMNNETSGNIEYTHYFNNDKSKVTAYADTNERYEVGVKHALNQGKSPWSVGASVFSEKNLDGRNNGGNVSVTYNFGGGNAHSLRQNANTKMNDVLRDNINTTSQHSVKNVDGLGNIVTTQKVEQTTEQQQETLDTPTEFTTPTFVVENDNTIRITDHGINDVDGVQYVQYILTTEGGAQILSTNGVFSGLRNGTFSITANAEVRDAKTGEWKIIDNPHSAMVTINKKEVVEDIKPIRTPEMIKADVEKYMATLEKRIEAGSEKEYILNLGGLPKDAIIENVSVKRYSDFTTGEAYALVNHLDRTITMGIKNSNDDWAGNDLFLDITINGIKYSFLIEGIVEQGK